MNLHDPVAVDASVAVKWVVTTEPLSTQARALYVATVTAGRPLVCPPHMHGEVANALYQRSRSQDPARHISAVDALIALRLLLTMPVQPIAVPGLYDDALAFAHSYALPSIYHSLYVVLAHYLGADLWTADQRLLTALGANAPWVKFIGSYTT